jgi:inhibitor of KinA sporulation pathway (predicted exonuclease)
LQYIIMDLEWNQPISLYSSVYKRVGDILQFELIQIGAYKLDENRRLKASFCTNIKPTCYKKLHPRIKRITGIRQEGLELAPDFAEAMKNFLDWCGEDFMLFTWGDDDISILAQNLNFYKFDTKKMPPIYDLQRLFGSINGDSKNRLGLRKAMDMYNIKPSIDHPFHCAVDDSYYTALIFQQMPEDLDYAACQTRPKQLGKKTNHENASRKRTQVRSINSVLRSREALNPLCPACGRKTKVKEGYLPQGDELNFAALSDCNKHGLIYTHLQFTKRTAGYALYQYSTLSDEQHPAYVKTKHLQWKNKIANLKAKESK